MAVDTLAKAQSAIRKYEVEVLGQVAKLSADIWADSNRLQGLVNRLDVSFSGNIGAKSGVSSGVSSAHLVEFLQGYVRLISVAANDCLNHFGFLGTPHGISKLGIKITGRAREVRKGAYSAIEVIMAFQKGHHIALGSGRQKSINMLLAYLYRIQKNAEKLQKLASMF